MAFCQIKTSVLIQGKLVFDNADLENISVSNKNNSQVTITQFNGVFEINCSLGDTLFVSSLQFEKTNYIVQEEDIKKQKVFIRLKIQNNNLAEVEINQFKKINSKSLGLISKDIKVFTPAERRLSAASGGITGLLNLINGTTSRLKDELQIEKKEFAKEKVSNYYEDAYFSETLKIPMEKIEGFKFYLVEHPDFVAALNSKNKTLALFFLKDVAEEYKKINKE